MLTPGSGLDVDFRIVDVDFRIRTKNGTLGCTNDRDNGFDKRVGIGVNAVGLDIDKPIRGESLTSQSTISVKSRDTKKAASIEITHNWEAPK